MTKAKHVDLDEIVSYFDELEDPRSEINQLHPLPSVVVIAVMAVLAGAAGPTAIARWAKIKAEFLVRVLELPNGIPRKDVFRRVLCLLKPDAFQHCFVRWLQSLRDQAAEQTGIDQPVLAVDGKTARRSHDRNKGLGALHAVSVWASEFGLSLGQVACAEKSNEITAIPELLRLVDIKGTIITIDAMDIERQPNGLVDRATRDALNHGRVGCGRRGAVHRQQTHRFNFNLLLHKLIHFLALIEFLLNARNRKLHHLTDSFDLLIFLFPVLEFQPEIF